LNVNLNLPSRGSRELSREWRERERALMSDEARELRTRNDLPAGAEKRHDRVSWSQGLWITSAVSFSGYIPSVCLITWTAISLSKLTEICCWATRQIWAS
jgi:hypothetical protein